MKLIAQRFCARFLLPVAFTTAAGGVGAMLAATGFIMQRVTGNPIAGREVLGGERRRRRLHRCTLRLRLSVADPHDEGHVAWSAGGMSCQ